LVDGASGNGESAAQGISSLDAFQRITANALKNLRIQHVDHAADNLLDQTALFLHRVIAFKGWRASLAGRLR
jgi:hypothetical protein